MQTFICPHCITLLMGGADRTTIMVSRAVKKRFLRKVMGAGSSPKNFQNADEAMIALMDKWDGKEEVRSVPEGGSSGASSR